MRAKHLQDLPEIDHFIGFRVSKEQYNFINQNAEAAGIKVSEYCRRVFNNKDVLSRPIIVHDDAEIVAGLHQLAKIGNNLNQIARFINEHHSMNPAVTKLLEEVLRDTKLLIIDINRALEDEYGRH